MIIPAKNRVVLKRVAEAPKSDSLLVIPEQFQVMSCKGEVVAVGRDFEDQWQPGDIVLFGEHNEEKVVLDDIEYLVVWGDDIRLREGEPR